MLQYSNIIFDFSIRPIVQFKTVVGRRVYNKFSKVNIDNNVSKSNITHHRHKFSQSIFLQVLIFLNALC